MSNFGRTLSLLLPLALAANSACAVAVGDEELAFEVGHLDLRDNGFQPYRAGDAMNVLTAVQAGLWLMPTIRYQGFAGDPEIRCTARDLDKGVLLASGAAYTDVRNTAPWIQVAYNMSVDFEGETMEAEQLVEYEGDRVLFQCRIDDELGNSLAVSYDMVLHVQ